MFLIKHWKMLCYCQKKTKIIMELIFKGTILYQIPFIKKNLKRKKELQLPKNDYIFSNIFTIMN